MASLRSAFHVDVCYKNSLNCDNQYGGLFANKFETLQMFHYAGCKTAEGHSIATGEFLILYMIYNR